MHKKQIYIYLFLNQPLENGNEYTNENGDYNEEPDNGSGREDVRKEDETEGKSSVFIFSKP